MFDGTHSVSIGYILWIFGFTGSHRFYYGKPISGSIWFLTLGLLGIGWLIDVFLIPGEPVAMRVPPSYEIERAESDPLTPEEVEEIAEAVLGKEDLGKVGKEVGEISRWCGRCCLVRWASLSCPSPNLLLLRAPFKSTANERRMQTRSCWHWGWPMSEAAFSRPFRRAAGRRRRR